MIPQLSLLPLTRLFLSLALVAIVSFAHAAESPARPARTVRGTGPFIEFVEALRNGDTNAAFARLDGLAETDPDFLSTLIQASELLAENGRTSVALPYVQRAYRKAPNDMAVVHAFIRVQLLARTNLSEPLVTRRIPAGVPEEFRFITNAPTANSTNTSRTMSRRRALADLEFLEVALANVYSYADRRGANWHGALDALRASLDERIALDTFAARLRRVFTLFGDPHTAVRAPGPSAEAEGGAPLLTVADGTRVLALKPDRTGFLDPKCRVLTAIDGRPITDWLRVAAHDVPMASPHWTRRETVSALRHLAPLRRELGLPITNEVRLSLTSLDGTQSRELTLPWSAKPVKVARWPAGKTRRIGPDIGYLRINQMSTEPEFLNSLNDSMGQFRDTRGLVIDVRSNGGGSQDAIRTLLPYFLEPTAPMRIINVAAYRLPVKLPQPCTEGYLGLAGRGLYPVTSRTWSEAQRSQIAAHLSGFKSSWTLPPGKFSDWHVMGIAASGNPKAYFYTNQVVVLMDAGCFSATDNFLGALQGLPNVTLMGTASGGGSGRMTSFVLPNSRLPLTICQMASFRANGQIFDGQGVSPDVTVETVSDDHLVTGSDSVLTAAVKQLQLKAGGGSRR